MISVVSAGDIPAVGSSSKRIFGSVAKGVGSFGGSFFMFLLYYIFLLSGVSGYHDYLRWVAGDNTHLLDTVEVTQRTISHYIGLKTLISGVTGIIATIICLLLGIRFAVFWGFMTFVLNYIPSIGSVIATIFPVTMAFIQFDTLQRPILLLILLWGTQLTIGNFIDPKLMGSRMRLNTVTVIFGLVFWGYIWGVPGMLISVPMMVIIRLLLERTEDMAILARVMGYPARQGRIRRRPASDERSEETGKYRKETDADGDS